MSEHLVNKKRILKNTIMLWLRMLLSVVVSIYTSRIVLQTLGVEDYGIYGVVGGVVAMFGFLNAAMAGATSRFLTYEMGQGNDVRLKETFSSALIVHMGLALAMLILAETVGLWFLSNKLVISDDRIFAAHCVYQFTIISMIVGFTQVPYTATIIAHEKMDIYAYIELANVGLKLGIVYLLVIGDFDKLILYGFLVMLVSVIIALISRTYCVRKFKEAHFHWVWRPQIMRPMLSFSGWDLYGNMSVSARNQGITFLLNIFFGSKVNAAAGVATTVQGTLTGFAFNIITAFRPQLIKLYAAGDKSGLCDMMATAMKFSVAFVFIMSIPLYWELRYVLTIWLGNVPDYTTEFLRVMLLYTPLQMMTNILNVPIHATGNIKRLSFVSGSIIWMTLIPIYICFKLGASPVSAYIIMVLSYALVVGSNYLIIRNQVGLKEIGHIIMRMILFNLICVAIASSLLFLLQQFLHPSFARLILACVVSTLSYATIFYAFFLTNQERGQVKRLVTNKLHRLIK